MKADDIRKQGIAAPGNTYVGGDSHSDINSIINNLAILCGTAQEIAAQLAEMNEALAKAISGESPIYVGLCASNDAIPIRVRE